MSLDPNKVWKMDQPKLSREEEIGVKNQKKKEMAIGRAFRKSKRDGDLQGMQAAWNMGYTDRGTENVDDKRMRYINKARDRQFDGDAVVGGQGQAQGQGQPQGQPQGQGQAPEGRGMDFARDEREAQERVFGSRPKEAEDPVNQARNILNEYGSGSMSRKDALSKGMLVEGANEESINNELDKLDKKRESDRLVSEFDQPLSDLGGMTSKEINQRIMDQQGPSLDEPLEVVESENDKILNEARASGRLEKRDPSYNPNSTAAFDARLDKEAQQSLDDKSFREEQERYRKEREFYSKTNRESDLAQIKRDSDARKEQNKINAYERLTSGRRFQVSDNDYYSPDKVYSRKIYSDAKERLKNKDLAKANKKKDDASLSSLKSISKEIHIAYNTDKVLKNFTI